MCQTGGVRCSPHAREKLQKKRTRLNTVIAQTNAANSEYNDAKEAFLSDETNNQNIRAFKKAERSLNGMKVKHKKAFAEYKLAIREYNGTDEGVKRLEDKISKAETPEEAKKYRTLLRQGRLLRSHRKHNANMKKLEQETGLTLKERRGSFITLKDHQPDVA